MLLQLKNILARLVLWWLACIPFPVSRALAHLLAVLAWHGRSPVRRVITVNLALCFPDMPDAAREQLARQAVLETLSNGLQMPRIWLRARVDDPGLFAGIEGHELIDEAKAGGRGVILITPHLGCWELFILQIGSRYPVTVLCNNVDDIVPAGINDLVIGARMKTGASIEYARPGVKKLCEGLLQQGGMVIVAPDQIPANKAAFVFAGFFGQPAATMTLIPRLAHDSGAAVLVGYARRDGDGRYRVVIRRADSTAVASDDLPVACEAMNAAVEDVIREAPAQYLWTYKRFRTGPDGRRKIYK